jgi:hypothetical protein
MSTTGDRHDEALEHRVSALERDYRDLHELVDGQPPWSHRKRLHALENDDRARAYAAQALRAHSEAMQAHREARDNRKTQIREWGAFVLALVALIVSHFHL